MLKARCACGKALAFKPEHAGKKARCPGCGAVVTLAASAAPAAAGPKPKLAVRAIPCKNHADAPKAAACSVCGAPICPACKRQRGYFCSDECRAKARSSEAEIEQRKQEGAEAQKAMEKAGRIFKWIKIGGAAAAVLIVAWIVWAIFGPKRGKIVWEVPLGNASVSQMFEYEGSVVATFGDGTVARWDPESGAPLGLLKLEGGMAWGFGEPMRTASGLLIVPTSDGVRAVKLADLSSAWSASGSAGSAAVGGDAVYVIERPRWSALLGALPEEPEEGATPPKSAGEEKKKKPVGPPLVCLDAGTGKERWRAELPASNAGLALAAGAGPVLAYEPAVYVRGEIE
jgi:hypothetical protein